MVLRSSIRSPIDPPISLSLSDRRRGGPEGYGEEEGDGEDSYLRRILRSFSSGKLTDGSIFDSSHERGDSIEFELGSRQVIKGVNDHLVTHLPWMPIAQGEVRKSTYYCGNELQDISVVNLDLNLVIEISDRPGLEEAEPAFKTKMLSNKAMPSMSRSAESKGRLESSKGQLKFPWFDV
ncbi:Peptidyl-prolyl cis-trans isomerase FKBP15-1 [Apostasia shenzhenica]|uniref:peptidylprolyl isomerase n=1 Tax=Apostasia shenzhenica TaxID=1088818 RepID=A0A2H9ZU42_9ASPA|nr:Peptidyl-prolyl cis-trans isomerase FKBP15-1 [Apostasia shenzhenica]